MQTAGTAGEKGGVFSRDAHIEASLVFSKIGGNGQHRRPGNRGKRDSRPLNSPKAQEKFSRRLEFTSRQLEKRPRRLGLAASVSSQKDSPLALHPARSLFRRSLCSWGVCGNVGGYCGAKGIGDGYGAPRHDNAPTLCRFDGVKVHNIRTVHAHET